MPWHRTTLRLALPGFFIALIFASTSASEASSIGYRVQFVNGFGVHIVQVDLSNPHVKVTPLLSSRFPGGAEPMATICSRAKPVAAVTGTFFSHSNMLPIGDLVIDGRLVHFGGMGSALALTPANGVAFRRVPYGRRQDWGAYESVMAGGPMLVEHGQVALAPAHERFRDRRVLGRASRVAVGITAHNKLLMVATRENMSLWDLAKVMRDLGCTDAINLDGGTSTGMYYRGASRVTPGRSLVNMLAVYENVAPETRTSLYTPARMCEATTKHRTEVAHRDYMAAQTPLAAGRLDEALRLLRRAADLDPTNASYKVRVAETLMRLGDEKAAAEAWANAGQIFLDKGLYEQALMHFRSALAADTDCKLAQEGLPAAYRGMGMEARARVSEYHLALLDLERKIVSTHRDRMVGFTLFAFAANRMQIASATPGPALAQAMPD